MVRSRAAWLGLLAVATLAGLVYLFLQVTADPVSSAASAHVAAGPAPVATTETAPPEPGGRAARTPMPFRPVGSAGALRAPATEPADPDVDPPARPELGAENPDEAAPPADEAELAEVMSQANKAYDNNDYDAAQKQALRVLAKDPENTRMLRVVVSSACMMGDPDTAVKYFPQLPAGRDQRDMMKRCSRSDIKLPDPKPVYPHGGTRGSSTRVPNSPIR